MFFLFKRRLLFALTGLVSTLVVSFSYPSVLYRWLLKTIPLFSVFDDQLTFVTPRVTFVRVDSSDVRVCVVDCVGFFLASGFLLSLFALVSFWGRLLICLFVVILSIVRQDTGRSSVELFHNLPSSSSVSRQLFVTFLFPRFQREFSSFVFNYSFRLIGVYALFSSQPTRRSRLFSKFFTVYVVLFVSYEFGGEGA